MSTTPTILSDIFEPVAVSQYIQANLPDVLAFTASGAATLQLNELAQMGGGQLRLRHFVEDTGTSELDDASAAVGGKLTSYQDFAVILRRRRTREIAAAVYADLGANAGQAINEEIGRQSTYFWSKSVQLSVVSVLAALFDPTNGALKTSHRNDISNTAGAVVTASFGAIIDTSKLLLDNMGKLALMITPSKVWADLKKEQGAKIDYQYITDASGKRMLDDDGNPMQYVYYDGRQVIISDQFTVTGSGNYKKYTTFLFKPGALALGFQKDVNTRYFFDGNKNTDMIVQPVAYCAHVPGTKWTGTAASVAGPTEPELATATNWSKTATNNKEIGVVALQTNASA